MYDAIVAGLGPAGSSAAHTLAKSGFKTLAIDKAHFPRYKSCGGCVSVKVGRTLGFDISEAVEETIYGAIFTYKSEREIDIASDRVIGYNVMRDVFDHLLVRKASEAGAEIIEGLRVNGIREERDSVTVRCADGREFKGRFLIGADGASGVAGREHFGLNPKECAVSLTAEVPYDRSLFNGIDGRLFIDFGSVPFGYGWIFPKRKYLSVGLAGDYSRTRGKVKDYFNAFASSHRALKGLRWEKTDGWTVPIFYSGARSLVKGRVLLAGDTGHLVDPFLGEGIYYAIRTGKAAGSAVEKALLSGSAEAASYQAWLEKEIYPEFKAAEKLSDLVYNHPRLWYSIVEKEHEIMDKFYDVIRGETDCQSFFNWVAARVRSKPWKVLRRWLESRFIPS